MCDECRATLESFDAVGGQVMEDQSPVTMNDDAFAKTMEMVGKQSIQRPKPANDIPSVLADIGSLDDVEWRAFGGGIKQKIIMTGHDATARLLYMQDNLHLITDIQVGIDPCPTWRVQG